MKTTDKNERPNSLKYQWKLYGLVSRSDWATNLDKSVAYELIDNYMKPYGNTRASIGYLQKATGGARSRITASLRRLTERGPFDVLRKGSGTRPSEFRPKFELVSGVVFDTSTKPGASGVETDTSSGVENDTSKGASGVESDTQTVLQGNGLQPTYLVGREIDPAPAGGAVSAHADGAPTAAGKDGFEKLYIAYGLRRDKAGARAVYNELNPDAELQVRLIEKADAWRMAAAAAPGCKRKYLATWLKEECWDCDVPGSWTNKSAAKPKPSAPANSNLPSKARQWQRVTIDGAEVEEHAKGSRLVLTLLPDGGEPVIERIALEDAKQDVQEFGQKQFTSLRNAVGIGGIEDFSELLGLSFECRVYDGQREYRAIKAEAA